MAESRHILDQLEDFMTSLDTESFKELLNSPRTNLLTLRKPDGSNSKINLVFHLICLDLTKEDKALEFLDFVLDSVFFTQIKNKSQDPEREIRNLVNLQTTETKKSPIFQAVYNNKKVAKI